MGWYVPDLAAAGLRIHYASAPDAPRLPALVFLHGAGANHSVWLAQLAALRDRAWVIVPDLPGHGRSEPIPGLTIDEYASAIVPFLDALLDRLPALHDRKLVLAGHSMGGAIALAIALSRPEVLSGLVLVGSGARLGVSPQILEGLETAPAATLAMIARWAFSPGADTDLIMQAVKDLSGTPVSRTLADFRACNAFDVRDRVGSITVPALIVCGREDRMTPPKYSTFLAGAMPRASLTVLEGAGHAVMSEAPEALSSSIADFLHKL